MNDIKKPEKQSVPEKNAASEGVGHHEEEQSNRRFWYFIAMPSWMVSFFVVTALMIFLAIWWLPQFRPPQVSLEAGEPISDSVDVVDVNLDQMDLDDQEVFETTTEVEAIEEPVAPPEMVAVESQEVFDQGEIFASEQMFEEGDMGELTTSDLASETSSRSSSSRQSLLKKYGGNAASEQAVALALKWIARHQLPDGGWSFDHRIGPGNFRTSSNPGTMPEARNGATAMALLPFLGNGQTHVTGEYKETVKKGLEFLMRSGKRKYRGISYHESGGSMYSHGLVAIVFCEAYAMTRDTQLAKFAQGSVWFIEDAQDPYGGGWRYAPKQRGDTSAVGWQLMALKSGKLSGLKIDKKTYSLAAKFLDYVSVKSGAYYGYDEPPQEVTRGALARTSIGLLCRMYMGWDKDSPALVEGVKWISDEGPSVDRKDANMYYNYYGTQLIKHYGGEKWKKWNGKMRDFLINTQHKSGAAKGSWMFAPLSHSSEKGGRLYNTALACMTLEVYYRYLPLYGDETVTDEFPLD